MKNFNVPFVVVLAAITPASLVGAPPKQAKPPAATAPASWMGETIAATAMRSGPSDSDKATGAYEPGQLVVVVAEENGYDHVVLKLSGIDCWVTSQAIHRMTPAEVHAYMNQFMNAHPDAMDMFKPGGSQ
jgi:hypothetical protein